MTLKEHSIKIVKGGAILGDEKSTDAALPISEQYISYGGAADLWGLAWTPADINAATFGVVFSAYSTWSGMEVSHYLKATNFSFSIPPGATIDGILAEFEVSQTDPGAAECRFKINHVRITVYYTEAPVGTNMKVNISDVFKDISEIKVNIGDVWKDVTKIQINIGDVWKTVFG